MQSMATGNRVHAPSERKDDLYETPEVAVRALLKIEPVPLTVWEPACGPGAIVRVLRASGRSVIATDLVDYACPDSAAGVDFLMELRAPDGVPAIVTNPPFKNAEAFVAKALDLVPEVYMLLRLAFLEGERWEIKRDFSAHLARVHVFTPRLPMMHRAGWSGPINSNSGMPFAWYVFHRDSRRVNGPARIEWCKWREIAKEAA